MRIFRKWYIWWKHKRKKSIKKNHNLLHVYKIYVSENFLLILYIYGMHILTMIPICFYQVDFFTICVNVCYMDVYSLLSLIMANKENRKKIICKIYIYMRIHIECIKIHWDSLFFWVKDIILPSYFANKAAVFFGLLLWKILYFRERIFDNNR